MSPVIVRPDVPAAFRAYLEARCEAADVAMPTVRGTHAVGEEPPFLLVRDAADAPARSAPVFNPARVTVSAYDLTDTAAARLYRKVAALVHNAGPAIVELDEEDDGGRIGIWRVFDETGVQGPVKEPETGWWVAPGAFALYMTDRAVG